MIPALDPCGHLKGSKEIKKFLYKNLIYSAPIRLTQETYIVLLIPALLNLFNLQFTRPGEALNSICSIVFLIWALTIPVLCYSFLKSNKSRLYTDL